MRKYRDFNFSLDHVRAGGRGGGALWIASVRFLSARNLMPEKLLSATLTKVKNQASSPEKTSFSILLREHDMLIHKLN